MCDNHSCRSLLLIPLSERPPKTFTPLLRIRSDPFFVLDAPIGGTPKPPHQLDSEFSDPPPTWLVWVDAWAHSQQG